MIKSTIFAILLVLFASSIDAFMPPASHQQFARTAPTTPTASKTTTATTTTQKNTNQASFYSSSSLSSTILFGKKAARAQGNERKNKSERVRKPKDDVIEVEAVVIESLPNAMFRCAIDGAPETQEPVLASISGKIRKNYVKILVGQYTEYFFLNICFALLLQNVWRFGILFFFPSPFLPFLK